MVRLTGRTRLATIALAGVAVGVVGATMIGGDGSDADDPSPSRDFAVVERTTTTAGSPDSTAATPESSTTTSADPRRGPLLVWTSGGLVAGLDAAVDGLDAVRDVTVVRGDDVRMVASWDAGGAAVDAVADGWYLPLDALAVDPASYAAVVPGGDAVADALQTPSSAVLSETSARLRRLGVGGVVELTGGRRVAITAVVPDDIVAAAEIVVSTTTGAAIGVDTPRSLLVRYDADRLELERSIAGFVPDERRIRFRERGETTYLRHGDAVLPQVMIKERFGEFSVRPLAGTALEADPAWVAANIVVADLPVLGQARCHRLIMPMLERALSELEDAGLTSLVDPAQFGGCYSPRLIGPGLGLSRHAWGIAVDVNVASNPLGGASTQDERLVEVMRHWGMAWGGEWLRPDPMHFEYLSVPR